MNRAVALPEGVPDGYPRAVVFYHYMHPDGVISARHFDGLCEGLVSRGWTVEARPCNRGCRDETRVYGRRDRWHGVFFRRVWRPAFRQASNLGRVANAAWMIARWCASAIRRDRPAPDVIVVGTDPILSVLVAPIWKLLRPGTRIVHWAYDLYPEAAVADGLVSAKSRFVRLARRVLRAAYARCDLLVDIGPCMRRLLDRYESPARNVTLVPWAIVEPEAPLQPDPEERRELFGDGARLALLYAGNFGRAHASEGLLALARDLAADDIRFCFAVSGNRREDLRRDVETGGLNIRLTGTIDEANLVRRLSAADVHLASLRPSWAGVVVPSKFFGSLAAGRPILFEGPRSSGIAAWIEEFKVGWVLDENSRDAVAAELRRLAGDPEELQRLQRHCFEVYREKFSRSATLDAWDRELRACLAQ